MDKNYKQRVKRFFNKEGFYIVLLLCICITAIVATISFKKSHNVKETSKIENIQEGDQTLYVEYYEDVNKFFKDINETRDGVKKQLDYLKELKNTVQNRDPINMDEAINKGEEFLILQEIWQNRPDIYTYNEKLREIEFGMNDVVNSISSVYYNLFNMETEEDVEMLINACDDALMYFDNIADIDFEEYVMK